MTSESVDLLIHNARVVTMDPQGTVHDRGSVAVNGSDLVAIGSDAELGHLSAARRLDAQGGAVMPGLINCHTHIPMTLMRGLADDRELMDWLQNYIFPAEARSVNADSVLWGTRLGCWEMLKGGVTTIVDMYYYEHVVAEELTRLGMRGILGQAMIDFPAPDFKTWPDSLAGMEAFLDNWNGHPLVTPAVAPHAPYTVNPDHLKECLALAQRYGAPLVTHLSETRTELETIQTQYGNTPIHHLDSLGLINEKLIAAHVVWPEEAEIKLLAQKGVGVAHCPHSNTKLASGLAPVARMLKEGIAVGIGTDGAASNNDLDLWQELQTAAFLQKLACNDPTVLDARTALGMMTSTAARAIHMERDIGSLEVGKRADLILVRLDGPHQLPVTDVVSQLVYTTKSTDVTHVMIHGRMVVEEGTVLGIDEPELRAAVAEQAARIQAALVR